MMPVTFWLCVVFQTCLAKTSITVNTPRDIFKTFVAPNASQDRWVNVLLRTFKIDDVIDKRAQEKAAKKIRQSLIWDWRFFFTHWANNKILLRILFVYKFLKTFEAEAVQTVQDFRISEATQADWAFGVYMSYLASGLSGG